jgi:hypothetical protein
VEFQSSSLAAICHYPTGFPGITLPYFNSGKNAMTFSVTNDGGDSLDYEVNATAYQNLLDGGNDIIGQAGIRPFGSSTFLDNFHGGWSATGTLLRASQSDPFVFELLCSSVGDIIVTIEIKLLSETFNRYRKELRLPCKPGALGTFRIKH